MIEIDEILQSDGAFQAHVEAATDDDIVGEALFSFVGGLQAVALPDLVEHREGAGCVAFAPVLVEGAVKFAKGLENRFYRPEGFRDEFTGARGESLRADGIEGSGAGNIPGVDEDVRLEGVDQICPQEGKRLFEAVAQARNAQRDSHWERAGKSIGGRIRDRIVEYLRGCPARGPFPCRSCECIRRHPDHRSSHDRSGRYSARCRDRRDGRGRVSGRD